MVTMECQEVISTQSTRVCSNDLERRDARGPVFSCGSYRLTDNDQIRHGNPHGEGRGTRG